MGAESEDMYLIGGMSQNGKWEEEPLIKVSNSRTAAMALSQQEKELLKRNFHSSVILSNTIYVFGGEMSFHNLVFLIECMMD